MICSTDGGIGADIVLNGERLEQVVKFQYLGVDIEARGSMETEVRHRVGEGAKVLGALRGVWRKRDLPVEAKMGMFEGIVVPSVLYGCEAWALNAWSRKRIKVLEIKCLRTITGVRWFDRVRNTRVRERCAETGVVCWRGQIREC